MRHGEWRTLMAAHQRGAPQLISEGMLRCANWPKDTIRAASPPQPQSSFSINLPGTNLRPGSRTRAGVRYHRATQVNLAQFYSRSFRQAVASPARADCAGFSALAIQGPFE